MKKMMLLIDGDIIAYRAAAAAETRIDWGEGEPEYYSEENAVADIIDADMRDLCREQFEPFVCLSGTNNFREEVAPYYKGNRVGKRTPIHRRWAEQYLRDNYPYAQEDRLEGDDLLGMYQTSGDYDSVIWTIDKDLRMIPGRHLDDKTRKIIGVTEDEGWKWFCTQVITGDPVDNYKGCPGVGKKGAEKALDCAVEDMWEAVLKSYEAKGYDEALAIENAQLAWMLRVDDFDGETKKVRLKITGDWI
jgi:DNA polymerase-1